MDNSIRFKSLSEFYRNRVNDGAALPRTGRAVSNWRAMGDWWKPIELRLYSGGPGEEVEEQSRTIPDYTHGVVGYALSARARLILDPLIASRVEFLPLLTEVGPYYNMNIRRVNGLDESLSVVTRYELGSRIMSVQAYAFHRKQIQGLHIFCLSEVGDTPIFVSNEFRNTVERNQLTGFIFVPVPLAKATNE